MSVLVLPSITRLLGGSFDAVQWVLSGIVPGNTLEKSTHFAITMVCRGLLLSCGFTDRVVVEEHRKLPLGQSKRLRHFPLYQAGDRSTHGDFVHH
jgi:hypothetical protein